MKILHVYKKTAASSKPFRNSNWLYMCCAKNI